MDAVEFTESVVRFICAKLIKRKAAFALDQYEVNVLYWMMQYTLFATYRAVTLGYLLYVGFNLNYNAAAVATTSICLHN